MSDFIFSGNLRCTRDLYIGPNQTVPAFAINELGDVQLGGLRGMRIPHGTSAERPFPDGTENRAGYIRYNTETNKFESYGSYKEWGDVGGVSGGFWQKVDGGERETRVKVDNSLDRHGGKGISFYTSCRSQLIVDSTGNVGIGIRGLGDTRTTPCCALHVGGTSAVKLPVGNTAQRPYATSTTAHAGFIRYNNQTSQFEGFGAGDSWGSLGGVMDVDQDTFIKAESSANADNDELWFETAGQRRMTIKNDGNISVDSNMDIVGNMEIDGNVQITGEMEVVSISKVLVKVPGDITLNGTVEVGFGADAPDTLDNGLYLWNTGTGTSSVGRVGSNQIALNTGSGTNSGTERVRIDGNGNVGIGTTTPGSKLDINGVLKITSDGQQIILDGNHAYIRYRRDNTNPVTDIGYVGYPTSISNHASYNNFDIYNGVGNIILNTSNNVGIGTTNPGYKLEINGDIKLGVGGSAGGKIIFKGTTGDAGDGECVIENRIYGTGSGNEQSELLLFKANDISGGSGPDRIRLRGANIVLDTYNSGTSGGSVSDTQNYRATVSSNATVIDQNGNVGIRTKLADDLPSNTAPEAPLHIIPRTTNYANGNGIYIQQLNENYNAYCTIRVSNENDLDENGNFRGSCTSSATGDPMLSFDIHGQVGFSMGIDNTDNYFKIAQNWQHLESSTRLIIRNDGTLDVKETGGEGTYGGRIHYIGTSALGSVGHSNYYCGLKHRSLVANSETNYAILQDENGMTMINAANNQYIDFRIANSTVMRIASGKYLDLYNVSSTSATFHRLRWTSNNSATFAHTDIGTSDTYSFRCRGRLWAEGQIWYSKGAKESDRRIKNHIEDVEERETLDIIQQIKSRKYNYINPFDRPEGLTHSGRVYGFIAQEVEAIRPELVSEQKRFIPNVFCIYSNDDDLKSFYSTKCECLEYIHTDNKILLKIPLIPGSYDEETETYHRVSFRGQENPLAEEEDLELEISYNDENYSYLEIEKEYYVLLCIGVEVNDFKALDYDSLFALYHKAIQDLDTKQQELISENTLLKSQVQDLLNRVIALENA